MDKAPYLARFDMLVFSPGVFCGCFTIYFSLALYHAPSLIIIRAASRAAKANHEMECCP